MLPAKYQPNPPGVSEEEDFWMVFNIYGHGGHLEFQIIHFTYFSLILYIHHKNAKYWISLILAQYFYKKCHLNFYMNGSHGNHSCIAIFIKNFIYVIMNIVFNIPVKNQLSSSKGSYIGNFASFFLTLPHPINVYLWPNQNEFSYLFYIMWYAPYASCKISA